MNTIKHERRNRAVDQAVWRSKQVIQLLIVHHTDTQTQIQIHTNANAWQTLTQSNQPNLFCSHRYWQQVVYAQRNASQRHPLNVMCFDSILWLFNVIVIGGQCSIQFRSSCIYGIIQSWLDISIWFDWKSMLAVFWTLESYLFFHSTHQNYIEFTKWLKRNAGDCQLCRQHV